MSDLVGNPEDRFSHNEAHNKRIMFQKDADGNASSEDADQTVAQSALLAKTQRL